MKVCVKFEESPGHMDGRTDNLTPAVSGAEVEDENIKCSCVRLSVFLGVVTHQAPTEEYFSKTLWYKTQTAVKTHLTASRKQKASFKD